MDLREWNRAMRAGDYADAVKLAESNADPTGLVIALCALGRQHDEAARDHDAKAAFTRAIDVADTQLAHDDPKLGRARARLSANVYYARVNQYAEATRLLREAVELIARARGDDDPEVGDALVTLGYRLLEGQASIPGALDEAERVLARAIAILARDASYAQRLETARGYLEACARIRKASLQH